MAALVDVLHVGYADDRVASTITLIRDGEALIVVDPGMVASRQLLLRPLNERGIETDDVTDVVLSHHHPDHTMNAGLFGRARVHDYMATYLGDEWIDHEPEFQVSDSVRLLPTPGHTDQDVSTLVTTDSGLVVFTHLWWSVDGPAEDPFAADAATLAASRQRVLDLAPTTIVPGHGAPFAPPPNVG
jgi:glyoxylase-like metal-dependent hydrolase (beta-lactamase superfamily II)